ncbi:MAG: hypothetical protein V3V29_01575 [Acidimicrobiia bacterium]
MRRLIVLAALLALVATACKLETNFGTIINADGSGTIIAEIGFDDEAAELLLQGEDPFEGNDFAEVPGSRTREERRGDLTYYIIEIDVDDITQAESRLLEAENSLLSNLEITVSDTLVTVSGTATADETFGGEAEGFDSAVLEDALSASVYFNMPGAITSHNANRREGNTLFWDLPVLGGTLDIRAQSDPTGTPAGDSSGFPAWAYVVIALFVLGALYYFMKGRSSGAGGDDASATAEAASDDSTDDALAPPPPPSDE